jgi:hypothetical protein
MNSSPSAFWGLSPTDVLQQLQTTTLALTSEQAEGRFERFGANRLPCRQPADAVTLPLEQRQNSVVLFLRCGQ